MYLGQDAQLSQRDRAVESVIVLAKSGRLKLGDNILRTLWPICNHCDIFGLKIYRIRRKQRIQGLLRRSMSFKVIKVGTNRKPVCDFILVINSN